MAGRQRVTLLDLDEDFAHDLQVLRIFEWELHWISALLFAQGIVSVTKDPSSHGVVTV